MDINKKTQALPVAVGRTTSKTDGKQTSRKLILDQRQAGVRRNEGGTYLSCGARSGQGAIRNPTTGLRLWLRRNKDRLMIVQTTQREVWRGAR